MEQRFWAINSQALGWASKGACDEAHSSHCDNDPTTRGDVAKVEAARGHNKEVEARKIGMGRKIDQGR